MNENDDKTLVSSLPQNYASARRVASVSQLPFTLLTFGEGKGINPLINAAAPLFILLASLRQVQICTDVNKLSDRLLLEVKTFLSRTQLAQLDSQSIQLASYFICAVMDEAALKTLQNRGNLWIKKSLLGTFHKDGGAGENFFFILERLMREPTPHQEVLEFASLCLDLGFQGKYAVMDNGATQLQLFKDKLADLLVKLPGRELTALKTTLEVEKRSRALQLRFKFRDVLLAVVGASLLLYTGFALVLNYQSSHTQELLRTIAQMQSS